LLIDADEKFQIERASSRDNVPEDQIKSIIEAQMPRSDKISLANDIVSNDSTLENLKEKIISLHDTYIELARKK
jgi:dephospho-CoA kinase